MSWYNVLCSYVHISMIRAKVFVNSKVMLLGQGSALWQAPHTHLPLLFSAALYFPSSSLPPSSPLSLSLPVLQVMSKGQVREFDRPHRLLQQPRSLFRYMVDQTGEKAAHKLYEMVQDADMHRRGYHRDSRLLFC